MRVLIAGADGYLGWPLLLHLEARGHAVAGLDNLSRRELVEAVNSLSAVPIAQPEDRFAGREFHLADLVDYLQTCRVLREFKPDVVVHLAEQPSAPYSMASVGNAVRTQRNNVIGTLVLLFALRNVCPECHLVKLGTMGEYGTPDCDLPEGRFPPGSSWAQATDDNTWNRGDLSGLMFPRQAGSWYHLSKVHDSHNIEFACRAWGMRSTDLMQGVVYGTRTGEIDGSNPQLTTRLDWDQMFGTVVNRFVIQAVLGIPLTVYGSGRQQRGFIPLRDSIQCMALAVENPPSQGTYRTFNQLNRTWRIVELAGMVKRVAVHLGLRATVGPLENPRIEAEQHRYTPVREGLAALGYYPGNGAWDVWRELESMFQDVLPFRDRLAQYQEACFPDVWWTGARQRCNPI